jgi:hypothetical protein
VKARISRNLIGPQVRRCRWRLNWTQDDLAARLQQMGWNICRGRVARIEGGEAWVSDIEHLMLSRVFHVKMEELLPPINGKQSIYIVLQNLGGGQLKMFTPPE